MIGPLARKELRDQRPFLILAIVLGSLELVSSMFSGALGAYELGPILARVTGESEVGVLFVFAFAVASGVISREKEERTLEFLEALPITRSRIFLVKATVAFLVVLPYPLATSVHLLASHASSRTSLSPSLHLDVILVLFALFAAVCAVAIASSLLLSHLGRLNWLVLALMLVLLLMLEDRLPWVSRLNPAELIRPRFEGAHWRIPWPALRLQLGLASLAFFSAWFLFARKSDRVTRWFEQRLQNLGPAISVLTAVVLAVAMYLVTKDDEASGAKSATAEAEAQPRDFAPVLLETRRYGFIFAGNRRANAERLIALADDTFDRVHHFLPAEQDRFITAELGGSAHHTSGTATWESLKMTLHDSPERDRSTLAHETAHVLAARLAGREASNKLAQLRLFDEGLASWITGRIAPDPEAMDADLFVAAVMRARGEVHFEELIDAEAMAANRDWGLTYPLGTLLIEALVDRTDESGPKRVLESLREAPPDVDAINLWQFAFRRAGTDLPTVVDAFYARLDREVAARRESIDVLPRPRAALETSEAWVGIRVLLSGELPEGWEAVCRFRAADDTSRFRYHGPYEVDLEDPICWRRTSQVKDGYLRYQLGVRDAAGRTLYEPWDRLPVD